MPTVRFLGVLLAIGCFGINSVVFAQSKPIKTEDVQTIQTKYLEEYRAAVDQKFPPGALAVAEGIAKRGEKSLADGSLRDAYRAYKEARWQLPYLPPDLPKHVSRVFGNTRMRQGGTISGIAFNPEGTQLASGCYDGSAKIWDLGNGREIRAYHGHTEPIRALAWSADGKWIATAAGNEIHLWDAKTCEVKHKLKGHKAPVNSVCFRSDTKALVSGSDDRTILIWNLEKGTETQTLNAGQNSSTIFFVTYSPNDQLVASTNGQGFVQLWKPEAAEGKKLVLGFEAQANGAYQVAFSPKMNFLYTCGGEKVAKQFGGTAMDGTNISGTGAIQRRFDTTGGGHSENVTALALSPDGKTLVTGSRDKSIRVWDLNIPKVIRTLQGHTDEITALVFSKDGTQLASASKDQNIRLWNLSSTDEHRNFVGHEDKVWSVASTPDGKLLASAGADRKIIVRKANGDVIKEIAGHTAPVTAIAFNAEGTRLASCGGDMLVKVWEPRTGELIKELKGHTSAVMAVAYSGDGKRILSGGADKIVKLWDAETGALISDFPVNRSFVTSVLLRKDGKQAMVGSADGMIRIYDLEKEPKETGAILAHLSGVGGMAIHPDQSRLASGGGDKSVKVWSIPASGAPVLQMEFKGHNNPVSSVAISPDGRLLVSGGGDLLVKVWDLQAKTEIRSLRGHQDWVSSVTFAGDNRLILSGSVDKTAKLWELTNEETTPPVGHTRLINAIAVSADGKRLASGSDDRTIKIWDMESGQELFTLAEHTDRVTAIAFSPDGKKLVSGGEDRKIRIWDLETKKVVSTFDCDKVPVIVFTTKGDKFMAWFIRSGVANKATNTAQVFSADGKELTSMVEKENEVASLNFTQDGELVAMGMVDGIVRIWSLAKNERILGDLAAHQKYICDLAFTPDKARLVTGDTDSEVKIWDLKKREAIKTFKAHDVGLGSLAISPDGKKFVTVTEKTGEVKLWKIEDGTELRSWKLPTQIRSIAFTPDSKHLVTANADTTLDVLDLPD